MNTLPSYLFAPTGKDKFKEYLQKVDVSKNKTFILMDTNTKKQCLDKFVTDFPELQNADYIVVRNGEQFKTIESCQLIWKNLTDNYADRSDLLVNLGGGVITDMGSFAASVFKRGMQFCNVPTSLLAMIDAAIGGKTGVDFMGLKNLLGSFAPANNTYIDIDYLKTLPREQLNSGYSELLKIALIDSKPLWTELLTFEYNDIVNKPDIIAEAVRLKDAIVQQDLYEENIRKKLNFGHTIGHAIESYSIMHGKNPLLHGDAVAIGMICETWISNKVCGLSDALTAEIIDKVVVSSGKYKLNVDKAELLRMMRNDKKNSGSRINFTLLADVGDARIDQTFSEELIFEALNYYFYL